MNEVRSELQTLQRDLGKVRNDLGDLANALYEAGRGSADTASREFSDRIKQLNQAYASARRRGDQMIDTFSDRPVASLIGAFAVGLVLAGLVAMASMMKRS
ncbi:hypothetical protein ACERK3_08685 [Phycisphaerales bacterium AB-hyl4]|uniref:DUF883 family protein n=1 Tax=Natronomicrosphaera hydrolytica TaxID=3242702 RepID=A0ABV4U4B0_9BACT